MNEASEAMANIDKDIVMSTNQLSADAAIMYVEQMLNANRQFDSGIDNASTSL